MPYVLDGRDYARFGSARNNYCDSGDCVARASRVTVVSRPVRSLRGFERNGDFSPAKGSFRVADYPPSTSRFWTTGQALRHARLLRHRPPRQLLLSSTWPVESRESDFVFPRLLLDFGGPVLYQGEGLVLFFHVATADRTPEAQPPPRAVNPDSDVAKSDGTFIIVMKHALLVLYFRMVG
jgi:hypothetical protein